MHGALLLELLSQVIESLQAADLSQQPLLVALLHLLQTLPGIGNVLKKRRRQQQFFFFLPFLLTLVWGSFLPVWTMKSIKNLCSFYLHFNKSSEVCWFFFLSAHTFRPHHLFITNWCLARTLGQWLKDRSYFGRILQALGGWKTIKRQSCSPADAKVSDCHVVVQQQQGVEVKICSPTPSCPQRA